jgi:hypothetical protein
MHLPIIEALLMGAQGKFLIETEATGRVEAVMVSENPITVEAVWNAFPIKGRASTWGDEIYFSTPISLDEEHARAEVAVGSIAYWPPGKAICIFFGETPASEHGEPRAASPVNVFAKVLGDPMIFKKVRDGEQVSLEKA